MARWPILSAWIVMLVPEAASGQYFSYHRDPPRSTQSVTATYAAVDFSHAGELDSELRFDYSGPAYGAQYSRPNLQVAILFGNQAPVGRPEAENLQLIDASLSTWGEIRLTGGHSDNRTRFFIPILVHSNHRRVSGASQPVLSSIDAFSVTVIGIGTGAGFNGTRGKVQLEARATPIIGFATRSFGDATGSSRLFDGDVLLHFGPLAGRIGLTLGYGIRTQAWNVGASNLLEEVDDLFRYRGHHHAFRVGINW